MPLGTHRSHPAALLPPGPVGADQADPLLGAGAVPDGGRHALHGHAAAARGGRHRAVLPAAGCCWCRCRLGQRGSDYLAGPANAALANEARGATRELATQAERALRVEQLHDRKRAPARPARPAPGPRACARRRRRCCTTRATRTRARSCIDRGATNGRRASASPVINEAGVLGQVTRVYPLSSRGHAADRQGRRDSGAEHRAPRCAARPSAAPALGAGMELRFMAGNADVQVGDLLTTSGVDGVYPPGLPVAKVAQRRPRGRLGLRAHRADAGRRARQRAPCAGARAGRRCSCRRGRTAAGRDGRPAPRRADAPRRRPLRGRAVIMPARGSGTRAMIMPRARRPAAAAGQPAVHRRRRCWSRSPSTSCRWAACRRCPTSLALVLVFWNVHQPRRVGVGLAFVFGLLMDVHDGAVLGQHALAYTLL